MDKLKRIGAPMRRSSPLHVEKVDSKDEEEMKEFIKDPTVVISKDMDKEHNKTCRCHLDSSSHDDISNTKSDAADIEAKVEEPAFKAAGSHVMTRRITIAGGFLDIALFTANCEQLKFVLELGKFHIYYQEVLALLITSLVLQLLVGLTMFLLGCQVNHKASDETYSNFLNHATMGLVALITIVNIFINIFGPKGNAIIYCLGAFSYPNKDGPIWNSYLNFTMNNMRSLY